MDVKHKMRQLFRNKCDFCRCYCIFEYTIINKEIIIKCTHCQNQLYYMLDEQGKIENKIKEVEAIIKVIAPHYPDLQKLKSWGDFARPPFKTFQKSDEEYTELSIVED